MTSGADPAATEVTLGRVVGVHGLHGTLRVRPLGDDPTHLFEVPSVKLGVKEEDPEARAYEVARAAPGRKGEVRLELVGVTGREQAEALRGWWVSVSSSEFAALPEGEYYAYELVGCRVFDQEGKEIGAVREIWSTGAHDVLVVPDEGGTDQLIPTAPEIMQEVDIETRRITIDAIPGLLIQRDSS
jgi:16S rRNA processing protein RimM